MRFQNMKMATKQVLAFGLILLIMFGVNYFAINEMATIEAATEQVSTIWIPSVIAISDVNLNISNLRMNQLQHAFISDEASRISQSEIMIELIDKINLNLDLYDKLKSDTAEVSSLYTEDAQKLYDAFDRKWEKYVDLSFEFFMLSREKKTEESVVLLNGEAQDVYLELSTNLSELVQLTKNQAFAAANRAEKTFNATRQIAQTFLILTLVMSVIIAFTLARFITVPVRQLSEAAEKVSKGDLEVQLNLSGKDEIGSLANSFDQMTISLKAAREKEREQTEKLYKQHTELQSTYVELEEKNLELEETLIRLKNTQEQLLMKEKMAALGDLVAGVAHEINNPIGSVISSTDVSGRCIDKIEIVIRSGNSLEEIKDSVQLPKAIKILRDNVKVTMTAGTRIATIVKSLKTFARLDEAEHQKVDIHEGIDSSMTLLGTEIMQGITVTKDYSDLPKVDCYPSQLNQVFINLLKNAAQSITKPGTINIITSLENGKVIVKISDSGKGISKEHINRIFDFGFSSSEGRVKMGSGLISAYSIMQRHGGDIIVDSELGKGSTFTVVLPMK
jgi:signal transduction histidine kinase